MLKSCRNLTICVTLLFLSMVSGASAAQWAGGYRTRSGILFLGITAKAQDTKQIIIEVSSVYAPKVITGGNLLIEYIDEVWFAKIKSSCIDSPTIQNRIFFPDICVKLDSVIDMEYFTDAVYCLLISKSEQIYISRKKRENIYADYFSFRFIYNGHKDWYSWGEECYDIVYNKKYEYLVKTINEVFDYVIEYLLKTYGDGQHSGNKISGSCYEDKMNSYIDTSITLPEVYIKGNGIDR